MDIDALLKTVYEIEALLKLMREGSDDTLKSTMLREMIDTLVDRLDDSVSPATVHRILSVEAKPNIIEGDLKDIPEGNHPAEAADAITEEAIAENAEFEEAADADRHGIEDSRTDTLESDIHESEDDTRENIIPEPTSKNHEESKRNDDTHDEVIIVVDQTPADINDTVLHKKAIQNLNSVFTINDKFRFRRELFGNSQPAFSEALATVEAMKSQDEAEEYFFDTLGWDRENPDVMDFMRIVTAAFTH